MGIFQKKTVISLFDRYKLVIPSRMKWHQDHTPGKRVLFLSDPNESYVITFDEGMNPAALSESMADSDSEVFYQYSKDGKSIQLKRSTVGHTAFARFNINILHSDGSIFCLPGQMVVTGDYKWSNGIEPILIKLMKGVSVCRI